jgi:uncharacterized protein YkwD
MRHTVRATLLLAAVAGVLAVPAPAAAELRVLAANPLESAVVAQMNTVRRAHGLRPLRAHRRLVRAANDHAVNMARNGYFHHGWSNGTGFNRWIRRYWPGTTTFRSWSVGENLYWRGPTTTAAQVVTGWMNSPTHRHNLLKRSWRSVGVGAVQMVDPFGAYEGVPTATVVAAEYGFIKR